MRTPFLILVSCLFGLRGFTQKRDSIIYVTPDIVNQKIVDYLKTSTLTDEVYATLHHNDTTSILVSTYRKEFSVLDDLIKNSNRYIKVSGTQSISVLLQEDVLMSSTLRTIKNKGSEYESIRTILLGAGGFLIDYKGFYFNVQLIRAEYFQN